MFVDRFNSLDEFEDKSQCLPYHIRIVQRNGRKYVTIVENLEQLNHDGKKNFLETVLKRFKENFSCGGVVLKESNTIQLQGDHRYKIREILINIFDVEENSIKLHGF